MFANVPVYNSSLESETRIINTEHIEQVEPHANVPVGSGAVSTACCQVDFHSGTSIVVLIDFGSMQTNLNSLTGTVDFNGTLL
jgi:hypothetical protein